MLQSGGEKQKSRGRGEARKDSHGYTRVKGVWVIPE